MEYWEREVVTSEYQASKGGQAHDGQGQPPSSQRHPRIDKQHHLFCEPTVKVVNRSEHTPWPRHQSCSLSRALLALVMCVNDLVLSLRLKNLLPLKLCLSCLQFGFKKSDALFSSAGSLPPASTNLWPFLRHL